MTCIKLYDTRGNSILCVSDRFFRLPLADGTRVFMEFHKYLGPLFYKDKNQTRIIENWDEFPLICDALEWFCKRGHMA